MGISLPDSLVESVAMGMDMLLPIGALLKWQSEWAKYRTINILLNVQKITETISIHR
jgi:hypothetical protein